MTLAADLHRKFLKCIFDVRELFASDAFVCRTFDQFGHYLREIQSLFSVSHDRVDSGWNVVRRRISWSTRRIASSER